MASLKLLLSFWLAEPPGRHGCPHWAVSWDLNTLLCAGVWVWCLRPVIRGDRAQILSKVCWVFGVAWERVLRRRHFVTLAFECPERTLWCGA